MWKCLLAREKYMNKIGLESFCHPYMPAKTETSTQRVAAKCQTFTKKINLCSVAWSTQSHTQRARINPADCDSAPVD